MTSDIIQIIKEFGLGVALATAIVGLFWFILKWILEQFKYELECARKEREDFNNKSSIERQRFLDILDKHNNMICEHNIRATEFQNKVTNEHKDMIQVLGRINGYKH